MKRILSVFLTASIIFGCFSMMSFAMPSADDIGYTVNTDEVYFDVDFAQVGEPMRVKVKNGENEYMYKWYIDKQQIDNCTDTYTPVESDIESMITAEVYGADGELIGSANMLMSKLPVVYIETENREPVVIKKKTLTAHIFIQGNAEFNDASVLYDGETEIKGRGNSTWQADKKPYKLKLASKANLLGMGKNKHWVLLSNPYDTSLSRNKLIYDLSDDMGLNAMSSRWVDVVMNGEVVGNYLLCEHIRIGENRVDITDWDELAEEAAKAIYKANKKTMSKDERDELAEIMEADMNWVTADEITFKGKVYKISDYCTLPQTDGGYLLERYGQEWPYFTSDKGSNVNVSKPEGIGKDMLNEIRDYYSAFENAAMSADFCTEYNGKRVRYSDLADTESFATFTLINEIFQNQDFPYKSTYMYKDVGQKLVFGPVWDLDMSSDNSSIVNYHNRWTCIKSGNILDAIKDPAFVNEIYKAYRKYRYTAIEDMLKPGGDIDRAFEKIYESGVNNDRLWDSYVGFEDGLNNFKHWLNRRIEWLDAQMTSFDTLYLSLNGTLPNNSGISTLSLDGQKLDISFESDSVSYFVVYVNGVERYELPYTESAIVAFESLDAESVISVASYDDNDRFLGMSTVTNYNEPVSLKITGMPKKLSYSSGDEIDLEGLELKAIYADKSEKVVEPESVLSYVSDCIGSQILVYNRVTEEIGEAYVSLRYRGVKADYKIARTPSENVQEVIDLIGNLPRNNIEENLDIIFEAKQAYDALSDSAKSRVTNSSELVRVMEKVDEYSENDPSSVLGCYIEDLSRYTQRNRLVVVTKGSPNKLRFFYDGNSTTFPVSNRQYCISEKRIGNYSLITVVYPITGTSFTIGAYYNHILQGELYTFDAQRAYENRNRMITDFSYLKTLSSTEKAAELTFKTVDRVEKIKAVSDGAETVADVKNNSADISLKFKLPGTKNIALSYYSDGEWHSYKKLAVYVRSDERKKGLLAVEYPASTAYDEVPVNIATSDDINSVRLVSDKETLNLTATERNGYKIWQYNLNTDGRKEYRIFIDSIDSGRTVSIEKLDKLVIVNGELEKCRVNKGNIDIPLDVTSVADGAFDGFGGTIRCYKDSAAQIYAEKNGLSFINYGCTLEAPSELTMRSGDRYIVSPRADPILGPWFEYTVKSSDGSVISVSDNTLTAVAPGYARITVKSNDGLLDREIRIYVGGGNTKGDINADGKINSLDALMILQCSVGSAELNAAERNAADIDGDGKINSLDALIALRISTMEKSIWDYV